jgi:hypothetical protein
VGAKKVAANAVNRLLAGKKCPETSKPWSAKRSLR